MTEDNKPEATEAVAETPAAEASAPPPPQWEYRTELKINTRMRELIEETIKATKVEVERQRKKLHKLTYGV